MFSPGNRPSNDQKSQFSAEINIDSFENYM